MHGEWRFFEKEIGLCVVIDLMMLTVVILREDV